MHYWIYSDAHQFPVNTCDAFNKYITDAILTLWEFKTFQVNYVICDKFSRLSLQYPEYIFFLMIIFIWWFHHQIEYVHFWSFTFIAPMFKFIEYLIIPAAECYQYSNHHVFWNIIHVWRNILSMTGHSSTIDSVIWRNIRNTNFI